MIIDFDKLVSIVLERGKEKWSLTAIAGPPCAGKSTLAVDLCKRLNDYQTNSAEVFEMDGFHYDDIVLESFGWQNIKGAPKTFDVGGFSSALKRLFENKEKTIALPIFDRGLEISRNSSKLIDTSVRHLIVEGNYLLLKHEHWVNFLNYFDTTVFVNAPPAIIRSRLEDRWKGLSKELREQKISKNDLPNGKYVIENSFKSEFLYKTSGS